MEKKDVYVKPSLNIVFVDYEDVINTSCGIADKCKTNDVCIFD